MRYALGDKKMIRYVFLAVVLSLSAPAWTQDSPPLTSDEREVMAAALVQTRHPGVSGWLLIDGQTAAFPCDSAPTNVINVGGCSGMKSRVQTPKDVLAWIKSSIPEVDDEMASDLVEKSGNSVAIDKPFPLAIKQIVWSRSVSASLPADLGTPELAVTLSRVGFNKKGTKALLYIGAISWTDSNLSFGEYIYLVRDAGAWLVKDRLRVWQTQQ